MMLKLVLVALVLALASASPRRLIKAPSVAARQALSNQALEKARTAMFPGNDTQSAGYISFPADDTTFHFFHWTVFSRGNPATDPVVFWFTGGPGCSSQLALFAENGAFCSFARGPALLTRFSRRPVDVHGVRRLPRSCWACLELTCCHGQPHQRQQHRREPLQLEHQGHRRVG